MGDRIVHHRDDRRRAGGAARVQRLPPGGCSGPSRARRRSAAARARRGERAPALRPARAARARRLAAFGRGLPRRAEILPAALLALELCVLSFAIAPQQGMLRDWDDFAPAAMALECARGPARGRGRRRRGRAGRRTGAARGGDGGLARARDRARRGRAVGQWLVHLHDVPHGMQRVRAAIHEWPLRLSSSAHGCGTSSASAARGSTTGARRPTRSRSPPHCCRRRASSISGRAPRSGATTGRARATCRLWTTRAPDDVTAWRVTAAVVTHQRDRGRIARGGGADPAPRARRCRRDGHLELSESNRGARPHASHAAACRGRLDAPNCL